MDPVTLVVTAVALGASAGMKDTAAEMVKDAYAALKALLTQRQVDVSGVERRPDSPAQQAALQETLQDTLTDVGGVDGEVVAAARVVTDAVAVHDPDAGRVAGVNLRDLQAEFVKIGSVTSSGNGVRAEGVWLSGGFSVEQVRAGVEGEDPSAR